MNNDTSFSTDIETSETLLKLDGEKVQMPGILFDDGHEFSGMATLLVKKQHDRISAQLHFVDEPQKNMTSECKLPLTLHEILALKKNPSNEYLVCPTKLYLSESHRMK
ncbi:MAG: hypothetical protein PHV28_14485 [Kiritimatiellae bacterium]|nr:hypothetical protein [Kiritimatiellia bacterium]